MSIKKQYLKTKPVCKVTFRLHGKQAGGAKRVAVAGEFNGWNPQQTPMRALKNGDFKATVDLPKGKEYQYRFILDDQRWYTDKSADKLVHCDFANTENCVVVV